MGEINLSYVITTFNKINLLKNVLTNLLKNIAADEEIVITDGRSSDGTVAYLEELFRAKKIHQFVSEKDFGEAHGWNKSLILANGKLIKVITDDDVFDYNEIKKCKEFMLINPEIDVLGTNGVFTRFINETINNHSKDKSSGITNHNVDYTFNYNIWKTQSKYFSFCGLGWMLRKSSLPLIGLLDTTFVRSDAEYSLNISSGKSNLAWYTGKAWARVLNPSSNSITQNIKIKNDTKRLIRMYPGSNLETESEKKIGRIFCLK